jgi:hypothetical protein
MKITLKQLHVGMPVLSELAEVKPKSAKLAYRLSRIITSARSEHELLQKAQLDLLQKNGTLTDPEKGQWDVPLENRPDFEVEWSSLLETEIEVWGDPLDVNTLDGELPLSVDDYTRLEWLFNDSDPATGKD